MITLALFGIPDAVGGAATKVADLLRLLHGRVRVDVVLSNRTQRTSTERFLRASGLATVATILRADVRRGSHSVALGVCDVSLFMNEIPEHLNDQGIPLVWSNDMMWEFKGEADAVRRGLIDRVIFVSDPQRRVFANVYAGVEQRLIPNYVAPDLFPCQERRNRTFSIGRLSRPDPVKYPVDFPVFYEELGFEDVRYRVQAWSEELRKKYAWHRFGPEWELLPTNKMSAAEFLASLDLFVYPLGHQVVESWGRSTVEAMLTGCVPLVPKGHNFENMMVHGESGFICDSFSEFRSVARELYRNRALREQIGRHAAHHARSVLCDEHEHRRMWIDALTF